MALADFLGPLGGPKRNFLRETGEKINTLVAKLSYETYVCYHGNILEHVRKVAQTKTKYDQFLTQYASRLLQPIYKRSSPVDPKMWGRLLTFDRIFIIFHNMFADKIGEKQIH